MRIEFFGRFARQFSRLRSTSVLWSLLVYILVSPVARAEALLKRLDPIHESETNATTQPAESSGAGEPTKVERRFSVSPYLRTGVFGGYERVEEDVLSTSAFPTPTQSLFGAGAIFDWSCRFSFDIGAYTTSAEFENEAIDETPPNFLPSRVCPRLLESSSFRATPDIFGLRASLRYHLLRTDRASPWLSLGGRFLSVRSAVIERQALLGEDELLEQRPAETSQRGLFDLTVGAGLDWSVTPRVALTFDTEYGLDETGWTAGVGIALSFNTPNVPRCRPIERLRFLTLDLDVDTNRNGVIEDTADDRDEDKFLGAKGGAIVIANLDDDDGDCESDAARNDHGPPPAADGGGLARATLDGELEGRGALSLRLYRQEPL